MISTLANCLCWAVGMYNAVLAVGQPAPQAWFHFDGSPPDPISQVVADSQEVMIVGNGADIWSTADSFDFAYQPWSGDGTFTVRVRSFAAEHEWAKAGLMIRETLDADSRHAFACVAYRKGVNFLRRLETGGATVDDSHHFSRRVADGDGTITQQRSLDASRDANGALTQVGEGRWLRLIRRGSMIQAFDSADGENWVWLGTDRIAMADTVYVGFALSSHLPEQLAEAVLDAWSFEPPPANVLWRPVSPMIGDGVGLTGEYFASREMAGEPLVRLDPTIDFDWQRAAPWPDFPRNGFAVRWQGQLQAERSGNQLLHLLSDDRARLWLDGELLIDEWREHALQESTALVFLEAGRRYLVRIDYFENRGDARVQLSWSHPEHPKSVIPSTAWYPEVLDGDADQIPDLWEARFGLRGDDPGDAARRSPEDEQTYLELFRSGAAPSDAVAGEERPDLGEWSYRDVGPVGQPGSARAEETQASFELQNSGVGVGEVRDGFSFLYQERSGDFVLEARLDQIHAESPRALAGLMVRESLQPDSVYGLVAGTTDGLLEVHVRNQTATPAWIQLDDHRGPWLRLERIGNVFRVWSSPDGDVWDWVDTRSFSLKEKLWVGLMTSSRTAGSSVRSSFADVRLEVPRREPKLKGLKSGGGDGLNGTYGDDGVRLERLDSEVDFDWDDGAPAPGMPADQFSVRWSGLLKAPEDGPYLFEVLSDDGARLWLDGELVLDDWEDSGLISERVRLILEKDRYYRVHLDYYERSGEAAVQWCWSSPNFARMVVPRDYLYSAADRIQRAMEKALVTRSPDEQIFARDVLVPGAQGASRMEPDLGRRKKSLEWEEISLVLEQTVVATNGIPHRGFWDPVDSHLVAASRNGAVGFEFEISQPGIFWIEISGGEGQPHLDRAYQLDLAVDEVPVATRHLIARSNETTGFLSPYLKAGPHALDVAWWNTQNDRYLRLDAIRIYRLATGDRDQKDLRDWMREEIEWGSAVESDAKKVATSPFPLEGRVRFQPLVQVVVRDRPVVVHAAAGHRWWAEIELDADEKTPVHVSFENGGAEESFEIEWDATDLKKTDAITIRQGDALRLVVDEKAKGRDGDTLANLRIGDLLSYSVAVNAPQIHRFDSVGSWEVRGQYTDDKGKAKEERLVVTVVGGFDTASIPSWVGRERLVTFGAQGRDRYWETDSSVRWEPLVSEGKIADAFRLSMKAAGRRYLTLRTARDGLPVQSIPLEGFELVTGFQTGGVQPIKSYENGTQLLEAMLVMSAPRPSVDLTLGIATSGVLFEDGSILQRRTSEDFSDLGELPVRFFQSPESPTGVCHRIVVRDGDVILGRF